MQPTELQQQAWSMTVLADLAREASARGASIAPIFAFTAPGFVDITLDGATNPQQAINDFHTWWRTLGSDGEIRTYLYTRPSDKQPARVWHVNTSTGDLSVSLSVLLPAGVGFPMSVPARVFSDMAVAA